MMDVHLRPPRLLRLVAHLLIRGPDASYIITDLDASFARDLERGLRRPRATLRYVWNVVGSVWNVWSAGLRGLAAHGIRLDAKLGVRMLVKQPLVTAVAVLALGLGIPASLILLHFGDVVYSELPIPAGDRVFGIRHLDRNANRPTPSSLHDYERWMDLESFESIGAVRSYAVNVNGEQAGASPVLAAEIAASSFDILRARPLIGRLFSAADELAGATNVVLIGEVLWTARFARDPNIVGKSLRIGRTPHTVVGVMPADFQFPFSNQVWLPFRARAVDFPVGAGPTGLVFGRLADGVSIEDARVEMNGLTERGAAADPERFGHLAGEVVGMPFLLLNQRDGLWGPDAFMVQTLIFGLLMVVCGNVGTLILARTAARSPEITIRTALGASRARILTQFFVEVLVLAMTATGCGLVVANAVAGWLRQVLISNEVLPYWVDLTLTPRIVLMALALATLCAVAAGVLPALSVTRRAIQPELHGAASRRTSLPFGIVSSVLIVSEIVLSLGFLAVGGTWLKSALIYRRGDLGFDPGRYVVGTLTIPEWLDSPGTTDSLGWQRHVAETQRSFLARLTEHPAVAGVAMTANPPGVRSPDRDVILETPPVGFEPVEWDTAVLRVDVSFFAGLRRPILAGRDFNSSDVGGPPGTRFTSVIVNESFVRHVAGGRNPVGQRLRYERRRTAGGGDQDEWYEIVGVVGAFGTNPENPARDAAIYHPLAPGEVNPIQYAVEVTGEPEAFVPLFRQIAVSVDPEATATSGSLATFIRIEFRNARASSLLVLALAGAAFLLSATGVYALLSFTISRRTREIGIRTALGARATDIVSAVARGAVVQICVGLGLGVAWGWVLLNNQRNFVSVEVGNIPLTLTVVATVAASVCVFACAHPTRRGLHIQPTEALRES